MNPALLQNAGTSPTDPVFSRSSMGGSERHPDPKNWKDYLAYPRVLITLILCGFALVSHIAFGLYVWFFER